MNLTALAKQELIAHNGDRKAAALSVASLLDKSQRDEIASKAVEAAAWNAVGTAARSLRGQFFKASPTVMPKEGDNQAAVFQRVAFHNWYNCPLPQGILLGNATPADISGARDLWRDQSDRNARRADWAARLLQRLRGSRPVREQLTEQQLQEIAGDVTLEAVAA